jgi:hypothetical protein
MEAEPTMNRRRHRAARDLAGAAAAKSKVDRVTFAGRSETNMLSVV